MVVFGSVWLFSCSTGPKSRENDIVLLVSIDTLRADALGCYGNQRRPTPNLDRLATEAVRFSNAVAPSPWTIPSHASLLTSLHPIVVGATVQQPIPERVTTIAEHLADHGFATGAIVNCLYLDRKFQFDQGFQEFVFMKSPKDVDKNVDAALDFLDRHDGDSVFLFLHIFDVHSPYEPPSPYDKLYTGEGGGKPDQDVDFLRKVHYHDHLTHLSETPSVDYLRRKYDAGVARVDAELGRLFQVLKERQLYDDALIIVTSDHGEAFFEREIWVGHGLFLYSNELRIPMLAKFPEAEGPSGVVVHTPVSLVDVVPTMTDVLDLPPVAGAQGRSLRAIALDQRGEVGRDPEVPVFGSSSNTGNTQFIQTRRWKYIEPMVDDLSLVLRHHLRPSPEAATLLRERIVVGPQLFDLRNDPEEGVNLARVLPKVAGRLQERLSEEKERNLQHRIALALEQRQPDVELTEEDRQKLRSLGYAQ